MKTFKDFHENKIISMIAGKLLDETISVKDVYRLSNCATYNEFLGAIAGLAKPTTPAAGAISTAASKVTDMYQKGELMPALQNALSKVKDPKIKSAFDKLQQTLKQNTPQQTQQVQQTQQTPQI
jgi:hypothetical protein